MLPPSLLLKAFPQRLPERDPMTKYYDGDVARDRAFGKEFTPWSGGLPVRAYEEKWNPAPGTKTERGLKKLRHRGRDIDQLNILASLEFFLLVSFERSFAGRTDCPSGVALYGHFAESSLTVDAGEAPNSKSCPKVGQRRMLSFCDIVVFIAK